MCRAVEHFLVDLSSGADAPLRRPLRTFGLVRSDMTLLSTPGHSSTCIGHPPVSRPVKGRPMKHQAQTSFRSFLGLRQRNTKHTILKAAAADHGIPDVPSKLPQGASTDLTVIWRRLRKVVVKCCEPAVIGAAFMLVPEKRTFFCSLQCRTGRIQMLRPKPAGGWLVSLL